MPCPLVQPPAKRAPSIMTAPPSKAARKRRGTLGPYREAQIAGTISRVASPDSRAPGEPVLSPAFGANINLGRPSAVSQPQRSRHHIGVDVRLHGVGNGQFVLAGQLDVHIDVPSGVDDGGLPGCLVADQVGEFGDPLGEHRLEDHAGGRIGRRFGIVRIEGARAKE